MKDIPCLCDGRSDVICNGEQCTIAGPGAPGDPDSCRVCWKRINKSLLLVRRDSVACIHLGEDSGQLIECQSCAGKVRIKLHRCRVHGLCSVRQQIQNVQCCKKCQDYSPL